MKNSPLATTHAERTLVLNSLPESSLIPFIAAHSQVQSVDWLRSMMAAGLIDVRDSLNSVADVDDMDDLVVQWSGRVQALCKFMDGVTLVPLTRDAVYGDLSAQTLKAVFGATDEFKALLAEASFDVAESYTALAEHREFNRLDFMLSAEQAVARWVGGLVIADLPEAAERVLRACPQARAVDFPLTELGAEVATSTTPLWVTPAFCALQLSRDDCLKVLEVREGAWMPPILGSKMDEDGTRTQLYAHELHSVFAHVCEPHSLALALGQCLNRPEAQVVFGGRGFAMAADSAISLMEPGNSELHAYLPAYVEAGCFDHNPASSVLAAVGYGRPEVLENFRGRMPWSEIATSIAGAYAANVRHSNGDAQFEESILLLMKMAEEDGLSSVALPREALSELVDNGYAASVVRYLAGGETRLPSGQSVLERAETCSQTVANAVRAWEAKAGISAATAATPRLRPAP